MESFSWVYIGMLLDSIFFFLLRYGTNILFNSKMLISMHFFSFLPYIFLWINFLDQKRGCKGTSEVLLQQILKTKEHNFMELGAFLASTFKVGVDFADIWRILFVVCDLKDNKQTEDKHNQLVPKSLINWVQSKHFPEILIITLHMGNAHSWLSSLTPHRFAHPVCTLINWKPTCFLDSCGEEHDSLISTALLKVMP